jgi:ferrochelatase
MDQAAGEPKRTIGVLLMAYGGPDSLEDVAPYLDDVRGGRPTSPELLHEMTERYRAIGGRSTILELTRAQAACVERALNDEQAAAEGVEYRTYIGMRHWHPYIREVIPQILADGVDQLVAVVMAPHFSRMSVGAYMHRVNEALEASGAQIPVTQVESWKDQPAFIEAVTEKIAEALEQFPKEERDDVVVLFSAHSLPERILEWNDPYPDELRVSVEAVAARAKPKNWCFAFQSQGAAADPWLGPDVKSTLEELAAEGVKNVLMVPIGFVSDHVEVLYDVDIEHRAQAEKLGIRLERTRSLNDAPLLGEAVAAAVRESIAAGSASGASS